MILDLNHIYWSILQFLINGYIKNIEKLLNGQIVPASINSIIFLWYIHPPPKYKKYLIWPIKYSKHYKSTEYMKRTILSINMIGNEKQKTWQKNTLFTSKMLKGLCPC